MSSPQLVKLQEKVDQYAALFITCPDDLSASNDDYIMALAFRILASAAIEEYVEERCKAAARQGMDRLQRGQTTTTGRALVTWAVSRGNPGCIPVHPDDISENYAEYGIILKGYIDSVSNSHGVNRRDLKALIHPVGVRAHQVPVGLLDRLQTLADRRDPVVHTAAKKAVDRIGPSVEKKQVFDILKLLAQLDNCLDRVVTDYPISLATP
jgi:predicted transcriptional regulator